MFYVYVIIVIYIILWLFPFVLDFYDHWKRRRDDPEKYKLDTEEAYRESEKVKKIHKLQKEYKKKKRKGEW